jgi:hypothetical protein
MDDHVRFSGKKYIVGFPALDGNHYKGDAHRLRTVVKSFFFLWGWTPRHPRLTLAFQVRGTLGVLATACDW